MVRVIQEPKVLEWHCEREGCGKVLRSLYPGQLRFWKYQHVLSHKIRDEQAAERVKSVEGKDDNL